MPQSTIGLQEHLTFKGNLKRARYGWLRLTPAYSVGLVSSLLEKLDPGTTKVLDPFCGTGTTALVCAERGFACDTTDINPFLIWLARVKSNSYSVRQVDLFIEKSQEVLDSLRQKSRSATWIPPLHQVEKWWDEETLACLARLRAAIYSYEDRLPSAVLDLLKLALCRTLIEVANVSFGHQSMSFRKESSELKLPFAASEISLLETQWKNAVNVLAESAVSKIEIEPRIILCDARDLRSELKPAEYDCVITSPPYPNRMSYIRELRPYMYWLGYLGDGRAAGELDWKAIGGTWGCATSNVGKWVPPSGFSLGFKGYQRVIDGIARHSKLLSNYVNKYFYDASLHSKSLFEVVRVGGQINYIVGNSKFYDAMVPVEKIYAAIFKNVGFKDVRIQIIRKRTSKKELFEYMVSGKK